jgi:MAP/microtubule affinity-regulating kinase
MPTERSQEATTQLGPTASSVHEVLAAQCHVLRTIEVGAYGEVELACHLLTGTQVAVKILQKRAKNAFIKCEVDIMRALDHPHIIKYSR